MNKFAKSARGHLKMAIYEWLAVGLLICSVACLAYWLVSIVIGGAKVNDIFVGGMTLSADSGVICLHRGEFPIDIVETEFLRAPSDPSVIDDKGINLPGLRYHQLAYDHPRFAGSEIWFLRVSALIPCLTAASLAGFCIHRYRAARRIITATTPALNSPATHRAPTDSKVLGDD